MNQKAREGESRSGQQIGGEDRQTSSRRESVRRACRENERRKRPVLKELKLLEKRLAKGKPL